MSLLVDLLYLLAAMVTAPIWLVRMVATGKIRTDWPARFGRVRTAIPSARDGRPRILLHAVSVGEVNAIRTLVELLLDDPNKPQVIVATTTDTGFARAQSLFDGKCPIVRYPFDFSFSIRRFLNAVRPDVVGLVELEVWPNFTALSTKRGIPVGVINGRLSARSFARYQRVLAFVRPSFRRLSFAAAQTEAYADRFRAMGVPAERVSVTDTMKWDTAVIEDHVPGADELADALGIDRGRPLIVAGSTSPEEHRLCHDATPEGVQLLCAPRKPEWFDQAAADLPGCVRRSKGNRGSETGRFLLDTIGELRKAYSLADVAIVGRTFAPYGGSDMMEPISLGKVTVMGPDVTNFADTAAVLLERNGVVQTDAGSLSETLSDLLADEPKRAGIAERGREVIRAHQGASARHAAILLDALSASRQERATNPHHL